MAGTTYDINGRKYSLTSATVELLGFTALGATELKLGEKLEPGAVEGTSPVPVGWTTGPWSGNGGFRLPLKEALDLKRNAGGSFGTRIMSGSWTFTEVEGDGVETITINGARCSSVELDGGDRSKASTIAFELTLTQPSTWGGVKLYDPDTGLFDAAVTTFSLSF